MTSTSATPERLRERLIQVLALAADAPFSEESAREAIVREGVAGAMCDRLTVDGKRVTGSFANYWQACFGKKWRERGKGE